MENNTDSCFHQQHLHTPSANLRLLGHTFDLGQLNDKPMCRNPYPVKDSTFTTRPLFRAPEVPPTKTTEPIEIPNWFHAIPYYRQAFTASLVSAPKEKSPASLTDFIQHGVHKTCFGSTQKNFLVFDQSGDKTTMIYSSEVKCGNDWVTISPSKESLNCTYNPSPMANDEEREDRLRYVSEDEMHEDTEELNALLYSDSYSSDDDDDTTSTGHSPSTISDNGIMDDVIETEVESIALPTKRQKLFDGGYKIPSHLKTRSQSASEDHVESNRGHEQDIENKDASYFEVKRSRKEKIRETVNILQSLIPSMSEKNPIGVLDEAIHYLRSLKVKAKALGFDSL